MSERHDGGPAFPQHSRTGIEKYLHDTAGEGLTLRDYFAGQVLTCGKAAHSAEDLSYRARWAYKQADAMLAAREKD